MLRDIRNNYQKNKLEEDQLTSNPIAFFKQWLDEAIKNDVNEPTAMVLSTAINNQPDSRIVLLKEIQEDHFVFYTNYGSIKAQEIESNNHVALNFFWPELERQVRMRGIISKTNETVSNDYFNTRPRDSQLGALASAQSVVLEGRKELEQHYQFLKEKFEGKDIPMPDNWGGYQITPTEIEFWQGRPSRLHDRIRYYKLTDGNWELKRLSP